jgi:mono/diheme cytochrome c family protein
MMRIEKYDRANGEGARPPSDNHALASPGSPPVPMACAFLPRPVVLRLALTVGLSALAACSDGGDLPAGSSWAEIAHGEAIYKAECAACHGANLEGQPDWRIRRPDGRLPAPPHDASGHTWHHPPEQLFAIVKFGMVPPNAPPGYESDMPAYGARLSDSQIRAALAYIESRWPPEVRAQRAERLARKQ